MKNKIKYLGIIIDDKLTFDEQIKCCVAKAASKLNFMYDKLQKLGYF